MNLKKKCKIIMLETTSLSNIGLYQENTSESNPILQYIKNPIKSGDIKYQNLYIINDSEIKERDYVYCPLFDIVHQYNNNMTLTDGEKKIIATTDDKISINLGKEYHPYPTTGGLLVTRLSPFPKPSSSFISKYIDSYNKGNIIIDTLVEYKKCSAYEVGLLSDKQYKLKVDNNNNIVIHKIKDSWNREEVIELCIQSMITGVNIRDKNLVFNNERNKWIQDNL